MHSAFAESRSPVLPALRPILIALAALLLAAFATAPASANAKYAGFVIDANTGKVLYAENADARRYPASLTKMMTLYMVFERLASGQISTSTRIPVSANAAAEPPSKIGIRAGQTITVESAIYALVTKSANDVATAVGEFIGGSEANFAKMTTAKARSLGMASTTFRNAHGLPNSGQVTTARDMATLGIALREHFPQYYDYFSTRAFSYGKARFGNHNKLLGRVKGVDGIKTGYIRASGFNLVTSVKTGGRSIVAVVMGGRTGRSRDAHMADLIRRYLPKASQRDNGPLLAGRGPVAGGTTLASVILPKRNAPLPGERPNETMVTAYADTPAPAPSPILEAAPVVAAATPPEVVPQGDIDPTRTASTVPMSGWAIQVGSMPTDSEAREMLEKAGRSASNLLSRMEPFTETFTKDGRVYHRARFGGFGSKSAAWNACGALKKAGIACYAIEL